MNEITLVFLLLWSSGPASAAYIHSPEEETVHNDITGTGCGVPAIKPKGSGCLTEGLGIINGEEARPHSWPWQVLLERRGEVRCGGSLINKDWVVTAAHCRISERDRVILGQHNISNKNNIQDMRIGKVIKHPKYNVKALDDYDIALIKLQSPAKMNRHVSPVCVAKIGSNSFPADTKFVATGWGFTRYNAYRGSKVLNQVCLNQIRCNSSFSEAEITNRMFCAGDGGADTCQGDSGGPLMYQKNGAWTLVGITSWGDTRCDSNDKPGVYTFVPRVRGWMNRIMASNP